MNQPDLLQPIAVLARQMDVLVAQMRAELLILEARLATALTMIGNRAEELGLNRAALFNAAIEKAKPAPKQPANPNTPPQDTQQANG